MPIPKPAPRGFYTDRSPPVLTKADKDFHKFHKRYPNAIEAQLAPREGHPLEQTVLWGDCPLAKAYPQWEMFLYELQQERRNAPLEGRKPSPLAQKPLGNGRKRRAEMIGKPGPSVADINREFGTCARKCDEL